MKRKRVFLTLALAPGLLVGAGAKIIGSKSVEQPAFAESTETLGYPTRSKIAKKTDTTSTEKKSATRSRRRRKRHPRAGIKKTTEEKTRTRAKTGA